MQTKTNKKSTGDLDPCDSVKF